MAYTATPSGRLLDRETGREIVAEGLLTVKEAKAVAKMLNDLSNGAGEAKIEEEDRVRLTGKNWADYGIQNDVVTITGIALNGRPTFEHLGDGYLVWSDEYEDYTVTKEE